MPPPVSLLYKVWVAIIDSQTTFICADADGQRRVNDALFDTMAGSLDHPPAHFGCRSMVDYWVEGQAPPRRDRAIRELERRFSEDPDKFRKQLLRDAKLRPPGHRQVKGRVRSFIRTTRQRAAFREKLARVERNVNRELRAGRDTRSLHRDPSNGRWDLRMKDRPRMHERLIRKLDDYDTPRDREALIVTGLPSSGRTSALADLGVDTARFLFPNADEFKVALKATGRMPRWAGLSQQETAGLLHEESSYLAERLARRAMRRGTNMVLETTAGPEGLGARVDALKAAGYRVRLIHSDVSVHTSVERSLTAADRYVPLAKIEASWDPIYGTTQRSGFEKLKSSVDGWLIFDNEVTLTEVARKGSWRGTLFGGAQ